MNNDEEKIIVVGFRVLGIGKLIEGNFMKSYRELKVWQDAMNLVVMIYKMTPEFPKTEKYGLITKMQRAAVLIPANIAEGYGRDFRKEYLYLLSVARGSLTELETHLIISLKLEYIDEIKFKEIYEQTQITGKLL